MDFSSIVLVLRPGLQRVPNVAAPAPGSVTSSLLANFRDIQTTENQVYFMSLYFGFLNLAWMLFYMKERIDSFSHKSHKHNFYFVYFLSKLEELEQKIV